MKKKTKIPPVLLNPLKSHDEKKIELIKPTKIRKTISAKRENFSAFPGGKIQNKSPIAPEYIFSQNPELN